MADPPVIRGYIKRVELENFMSHRKFTLDLGPNLNIIIGKNGSGKSSILTAIMVGLGASTAKTKRGDGMKDLIKHGETTAFITITFYNPPNNVKLRHYGESITVQRRIGIKSNSYSIKDHNMNVVSTKAKDLKPILEYFGIYPDNVLAMLTQESAKEFLVSDTPKKKYKSFMNAMKITAIRDSIMHSDAEIVALEEGIKSTISLVKNSESRIKRERAILAKLEDARNSEAKIKKLKGMLAWREVEKAETQRSKDEAVRARHEQEATDIHSQMKDCKDLQQEKSRELQLLDSKIETANEKVSTLEGDKYELERQRDSALAALNAAKERVARANDHYVEHNEQLRERRKLADPGLVADNQDQVRQKINTVETEIQENEQSLQTTLTEISDLESELETASSAARNARDALQTEQENLNAIKQRLESLKRVDGASSGQSFLNYNPNLRLPELTSAINEFKGWKVKPLGPLGEHLKVSSSQWVPVVESHLNSTLNSFVVQNRDDRDQLLRLIQRCRSSAIVILRRVDEYSLDEIFPRKDAQYTRFVDAIEAEDPNIIRLLVDQNRIQRIVLMKDKTAAEELIDSNSKDKRIVHTFVHANDMILVSGSTEKDVSESNTKDAWRPPFRLRIAGSQENIKDTIAQMTIEFDETKRDFEKIRAKSAAANEAMKAISDNLKTMRKRKDSLEHKGKQLDDKKRQLLSELQNLPSTAVDLSTEIEELENQLQISSRFLTQQKKKESLAETDLSARSNDLHEFQASLNAAVNELAGLRNSKTKLEKTIEDLGNKQLRQKRDEDRLKKLLDTTVNQINETSARIQELQAEAQDFLAERPILENFKESNEDIEDRIKELNANKEHFNQDLNELENRKRELETLVASHYEEQERVKHQEESKETLQRDVKRRKTQHDSVYDDIKKRVSDSFSTILANRGFTGVIIVDDKHETLTIRADPRSGSTTSNREVATLSGGEKSFTQLSLLLSIWSGMSLGLVAMDEYDVFMDRMNRTISLEALINTTTTSDLQGILITPQDVGGDRLEKEGERVKIHRLSDPTRESSHS